MSQLTATYAVNFKETYFIHLTPTKIQGEPTFHTLTQLHQELKVNAASVPSNLRGGNSSQIILPWPKTPMKMMW
jgi:hypothetical protein